MENSIHDFYSELDALYVQGRQNEIEQFLKDKIQNIPCLSCHYDPFVVAVYSELGSFCRGQGRFGEAIEWFEAALQLIGVHLGTNNMEYATAMNNLAGAQRMDGRYKVASINFAEAMRIYQLLVGEDNYYYISCVNNLSLLEISQKNYGRAEELLKQALKTLEGKQELLQEKAITLCNLGTCALGSQNNKSAEQYLHEAEKIYRSFPKGQQIHLAAICNSLGQIQFLRGNKAEAAELYAEAKDLTEFYFGRSTEYAVACQNLASCLEGQEACSLLQDGLSALESLGRQDSPQYRRIKETLDAFGV